MLKGIYGATTDEKWNECFFDRTDPKNANRSMNKIVKLNSFQIYWNSKEEEFLS